MSLTDCTVRLIFYFSHLATLFMQKLLIFFAILFFSTTCPLQAQLNWQSTNGPEGGASWDIFYNEQYAFYPDAYNLYRTADGHQWEQLLHGNLWPIAANAFTLAAVQGNGFVVSNQPAKFLVSHDNGVSFTEGIMPPNDFTINLVVCTHGIYAPDAEENRIYRSTDDGQTWDTIPVPAAYVRRLWAFNDEVYTFASNKIQKFDQGAWVELPTPTDITGYFCSMQISGARWYFSTNKAFYTSLNSGASWTKTVSSGITNDYDIVEANGKVYSLGGNYLWSADTTSQTWQKISAPLDLNFYNMASAGDKVLATTYNKGVYSWNQQSNQFLPNNNGLNSAACSFLTHHDHELWAACANGVFAYDLENQIWTDKALLPPSVGGYDKVVVNPNGVIAAMTEYGTSLYLSVDNGASWDTIYPVFADGSTVQAQNIFWLGNHLVVEDENYNHVMTINNGLTWTDLPTVREIVPFQGKYFAMNYDLGLVSSTDFGLSWQDENEPTPGPVYGLTLYSTQDRLFFLKRIEPSRLEMYQTTDGLNWQSCSDGLTGTDWETPHAVYPYRGNIYEHAGKYYFHQLSGPFFISIDTCKTWLPIERDLSFALHIVDSVMYRGVGGGGVLKSPLPQQYGSLSRGVVFKDDNNNGLLDGQEISIPNMPITLTESGGLQNYWFTSSDTEGKYIVGHTPGASDTLRPAINNAYVNQVNPAFYLVSNSGYDRNFGIHFIDNITDLGATGSYVGRPRPGFHLNTYLQIRNEGSLPTEGTLTVKLDPRFEYEYTYPVPSAIIGTDTLIWNLAEISLFSSTEIQIEGKVAANAPLGDVLKTQAWLSTPLTDQNLLDNQLLISDTIVGSYDPNEKRVEPARGLTVEDIQSGKELLYTVHFQNTGSAAAERVRITDRITEGHDISTLRFVAASHPVSLFKLHPGNLLEVVFDMINLPDSTSNEADSHGFVTFAIQRDKSYDLVSSLFNEAAIYFDFNLPIITNTVVSKVVEAVSTSEPTNTIQNQVELKIAPNPAQTFCTVSADGLSGPGVILISDFSGKLIQEIQASDLTATHTIQLLNLPQGVYRVEMRGKNGVATGKLVV
jgi:hypothetical protein